MRVRSTSTSASVAEMESSGPQATEPRTANARRAAARRALLREPLVHFLVAGAVLLALSTLLDGGPGRPTRQVLVSSAKLRQLRDTWTAQWGEPPSPAQLQALVDDYLREEILFREAVVTGLDRDDTIIRRHLAQKMEFLAQGAATAINPTESEVAQYFASHAQQYQTPAKVAFQHVYFSSAQRGAMAATAAAQALTQLTTASNNRA